MIRFRKYMIRPDGEPLYRMILDGAVVRDELTLEDVIVAINRRDELQLATTGRKESKE